MPELSLTAVDIAVIGILVVSAVFATLRGLMHETFDIIQWVVAIFVAFRLTPVALPYVQGYISPSWLEWFTIFGVIFLFVFIPLSVLSHRIARMVRGSEIGPVDRILGFCFGIARGLAIVGLAYITFDALVPERGHPETLTKARLYPLIRGTASILVSLVPRSEDGFSGVGRRALGVPEPAAKEEPTYGAEDRRRLDTLLDSKGGGVNPSR